MKYIVNTVWKHEHSIKWKEMQEAMNKLNKLDSLILDSSPVDPSHDSLVNAFMKHNNLKYSKSSGFYLKTKRDKMGCFW